jgi:tetratricopeptide (TPR) repeat protein
MLERQCLVIYRGRMRMRWSGIRWVAGGGAALAVLLGGGWARAQFQENEYQLQKHAAQALEPAPLRAPKRQGGGELASLRLRFFADAEYRATGLRWQEKIKLQLAALNQVVGPAFGVRFEAESFRRWDRKASSARLGEMLEELERLDPGRDVDWVVGLVAPLPLVTSSLHDLGLARVPGRHFLLRGMASIEELRVFSRRLDRLAPADREALYSRRKAHKEMVLFLHEWAHTLGALHATERTRIMCPTYSHETSQFAPVDAALIAAGLQARLASRGQDDIDWSPLRRFLAENISEDWLASERQALLAGLGGGGTTGGGERSTGAPWAKDEAAIYDRAVVLLRQNKSEAAWETLRPLAARTPPKREVARLACRLSHLPEAADQGRAACEQAIKLAAPDDPDPFVDVAQAHIARKERAQALAAAQEAAARAKRRAHPQEPAWVWIAQLYTQLGAPTRAEEALAHAGRSKEAEAAAAAVTHSRLTLGLPPDGQRFRLSAEDEPTYAAAFFDTGDLIVAGKLREARAAVSAALKRFPQAPGFLALSCEVSLRSGRVREAAKTCAAALAIMEGLPRAHFLTAHIQLSARNSPAAITSLKRVIALEPQNRAAWETLAELYRKLGRRKEMQSLLLEYDQVFTKQEGANLQ